VAFMEGSTKDIRRVAQAAFTRIPTTVFIRGHITGATRPHQSRDQTVTNRLHGGSKAYPEKLEEPTYGHAHRLAKTHDGDGCF